MFRELPPSKTGVRFNNKLEESRDFNVIKYGYFYNGGGVACGDLNNDGWPDLFFTGNLVPNKLYLNTGKSGFEFEDITEKAGLAGADGWNTGASLVDINQDGWLDIYVCRSAANNPLLRKNRLYINNRDLTFTEQSAQYGLDDPAYSTQAVFFDYDKDGDADCFILNHSLQEYAGFSAAQPHFKKKQDKNYGSRLLRNDNGRFTDVTDSSGLISNVLSFGLGVAVSDFNRDGWPDLYISNDYNEEDYCYINNKDGSFTESLRESFDHTSLFSMGSDAADINNDGWPDLVTLDMLPKPNERLKITSGDDNYKKYSALIENGFYEQSMRNMLQLNKGLKSADSGQPTFTELGQFAGISNTDWSWAALCADFDLDGQKDIFITNGYARDYTNMEFLNYTVAAQTKARESGKSVNEMEVIANMPSIEATNFLFRNEGQARFSDVSQQWGMTNPSLSNGAVYADLDRDGDLDLVVSNVNATASILENTLAHPDNRFLKVDLTALPAASAIGASVQVFTGGEVQAQEFYPVRGFQSCMYLPLTFGLGEAAAADSVVIYWPSGVATHYAGVGAGRTLTPAPTDQPGRVWIATAGRPDEMDVRDFPFAHQEDTKNDFDFQPLLPFMLSYQGPGLACSADGWVYACGARNQAGGLFRFEGGRFVPAPQEALTADAAYEDAGAVFFDADNDGDQDLLVVSAGFQLEPGSALLSPRLYRNDGGRWVKASGALPDDLRISAGPVCALDADGDGAPDIFIGSRVRPGSYPMADHSVLLYNDGKGAFRDKNRHLALNLGMVTGAVAADPDGDGKPDLLVSREWGTVAWLKNRNGAFDPTHVTDLTPNGLWYGLLAGDFDRDGHVDLICGNLGLNNQFAALSDAGTAMYAAPFLGASKVIPILTYFQEGKEYTFAARDELFSALPPLKKNFTDYTSYAAATVQDIFGQELSKAEKRTADELKTCYISIQDGRAVVHDLPEEAQFAPVFTALAADLNGDGFDDLILGGNITKTRVRIGRMDANHGQAYYNDGSGGFSYHSDLQIRGDMRDLKLFNTQNNAFILAGVNNAAVRQIRINPQPVE